MSATEAQDDSRAAPDSTTYPTSDSSNLPKWQGSAEFGLLTETAALPRRISHTLHLFIVLISPKSSSIASSVPKIMLEKYLPTGTLSGNIWTIPSCPLKHTDTTIGAVASRIFKGSAGANILWEKCEYWGILKIKRRWDHGIVVLASETDVFHQLGPRCEWFTEHELRKGVVDLKTIAGNKIRGAMVKARAMRECSGTV